MKGQIFIKQASVNENTKGIRVLTVKQHIVPCCNTDKSKVYYERNGKYISSYQQKEMV